jgi:general secretion pathway protein G
MKKGAKYYELFVMALVVLFFAALVVRQSATTRPGRDVRIRVAHAAICGGLKTALEMFKADCGRFPTTEEGWNALIILSKESSLTNWHGPYFNPPEAPEDPWGHSYVYLSPGIHNTNSYDLYSPGPDGVSNTADDIGNWGNTTKYNDPDWLFRHADELLLVIPVLFVFRIVAGIISREWRGVAFKNRVVDWLWFAMSTSCWRSFFAYQELAGD